MKRITRILVAVALMAALMVSTAFAAGTTVKVADVKDATPGKTITVDVSVSGNPGFKTYGMQMNFDKDALTLVSVTADAKSPGGMFVPNTDASTAKYGFVTYASGGTVVEGDGVLFTATFKVADNAKDGNYNIGITVDKFGTSSSNQIAATVDAGSVTVKAPHSHSYGDWQMNADKHWKECACGEKTSVGAHEYEWTVTKEATKTETGLKDGVCKVCGHEVNDVEIPAIGGGTTDDGNKDNNDNDKPASDKDNTDKNAQTGDDFNAVLFGAIAFTALMAAGGAVLVRRKGSN